MEFYFFEFSQWQSENCQTILNGFFKAELLLDAILNDVTLAGRWFQTWTVTLFKKYSIFSDFRQRPSPVRMKTAWVHSYSFSAQRRLWSDLADAKAHRSLRWAHMQFCWFVKHWLSYHIRKHISRVERKTSVDGCFSPNLISSPWRRYEDYNISFCKQWKFRCHCSYEQWHLNLHCLQRGPSCP